MLKLFIALAAAYIGIKIYEGHKAAPARAPQSAANVPVAGAETAPAQPSIPLLGTPVFTPVTTMPIKPVVTINPARGYPVVTGEGDGRLPQALGSRFYY